MNCITDASLFECSQCNFTSKLNRILKSHVQKKHPDTLFPASPSLLYSCELCEYSSLIPSDLSNHIINTHTQKKLEVQIEKLQQFRCQDCAFTAPRKSTLDDHIELKHALPTKTETFYCEFCPFADLLSINLKKHMAVKHAKIKCEQCNFTSASLFSLDLHKEHSHTNPQPKDPVLTVPVLHSCTLCGITFALQSLLNPTSRGVVPPHLRI